MQIGNVIRCIDNKNYERILTINKNYVIKKILDNGMLDIGTSINVPQELFVVNDYNFKEERNILDDIRLINDIYNHDLEQQISEVNYIYSYWSFRKNDALNELSLLEEGYEIWYHETIFILTKTLTEGLDAKTRKEILSQHNTQAKELRLIITHYKTDYMKWKDSIRKQQKKVNDLTTICKSIEMKALNLNVLNKNNLFEFNTYK